MSAPWILHQDDDLLALHKPAGVNTHRPDVHAQDGICEWASAVTGQRLSIHHRLDKPTSGVLVMGKTRAADKTLAQQFEGRELTKRYLFLTTRDPKRPERQRCDARLPSKRRRGPRDQEAVTEFELQERGALDLVAAVPHTGRTHQVRLHAARLGMPITGDRDYDGAPGARLFLHAASVELQPPASLTVESPLPRSFQLALEGAPTHGPQVTTQAAWEARAALFDPELTDCWLWIDREHDGLPGVRVERLGQVGLVLRYDGDEPLSKDWTEALLRTGSLKALVEQRRPRGKPAPPPQVLAGEPPAELRYEVREHGLKYEIDLQASGTSSGLFLDQRETRRRLLSLDLNGKQVLNAFAHTGALSVAAAHAGGTTLSLDLSQRYLDRARENLTRNGLDPAQHDFIYGDALDWMRRLANKGRRFDLVLVDPPSFSTGRKKSQRWSVERDLPRLVERGARLVAPDGTLYVSTNLKRLPWRKFLDGIQAGLAAAGRTGRPAAATLPLDHRSGPGDPPYLKAAWIPLA